VFLGAYGSLSPLAACRKSSTFLSRPRVAKPLGAPPVCLGTHHSAPFLCVCIQEAPATPPAAEGEGPPKPKAKNPLDLLPPAPWCWMPGSASHSNTKAAQFREVAIKGKDTCDPTAIRCHPVPYAPSWEVCCKVEVQCTSARWPSRVSKGTIAPASSLLSHPCAQYHIPCLYSNTKTAHFCEVAIKGTDTPYSTVLQ